MLLHNQYFQTLTDIVEAWRASSPNSAWGMKPSGVYVQLRKSLHIDMNSEEASHILKEREIHIR